jgi:hypothetical protein
VILILMTAQSGSSLVAKIFAAHGFDTGPEKVFCHGYETFENAAVNQWILDNKHLMGCETGEMCKYVPGVEDCVPPNGVVKTALEYGGVFEKLNPKVIAVKRHPMSIARSWADRRGNPADYKLHIGGAMVRMKGLDRIVEKCNGAAIDTDQIMSGDFSGVRAAFEHHGLEFDEDKARACVNPDKWHQVKP